MSVSFASVQPPTPAHLLYQRYGQTVQRRPHGRMLKTEAFLRRPHPGSVQLDHLVFRSLPHKKQKKSDASSTYRSTGGGPLSGEMAKMGALIATCAVLLTAKSLAYMGVSSQ